MKTAVCGLGKCGSRMVLDLSALIYGGKYSCQLRSVKENLLEKGWFKVLLDKFKNKPRLFARDLADDEVPPMHLGDSDDQNEVLNMCNMESGDEKDEERRKRLKEGMIIFNNYHDACGQYHIIGEEVMRNLFKTDSGLRDRIINKYINLNNKDNISAYFILFSAGGGTGCGTSTILAEEIAARVKEQHHNMLIAGVTAFPGDKEAVNYKISAGRFLTKFLSSTRSTSFDTVFTVSNSIMESIEADQTEAQTEANMFVAHLIFSIINSSSKYNRSTVNPDGPELRKNIHGLAYFCFAQQAPDKTDESDLIGVDLLRKALAPVSSARFFDASNPELISFEGASINFTDGDSFTRDNWDAMLKKIEQYRDFVRDAESDSPDVKGDAQALEAKLGELFDNPKKQLPLATRSCKNVVILRGIPDGKKSSNWEQTCLTTLVEAVFPKARVHYYATYHRMKEHTLTLLPSDYLSGEIVDLLVAYLTNVWEKEADPDDVVDMLLAVNDAVSENDISEIFGENEIFERYFPDFPDIREKTSGRFKLNDDIWDERYIKAPQVADMMNNVHEIVANTGRVKKERKRRRELDI